MKQFAHVATEIVRRITEADDDDFDLKDVMDVGQEDYWQQIDGDANPWVYGGSWYNPARSTIIHFDGIEYDKDMEPDDVPVPQQMLVKLPPEQEDWRENHGRDKTIRDYQYARAEFLNARKQRTFWEIDVRGDMLPNHWIKYEDHSPTGMTDEDWQRMNLPQKLIELGRYFGFDEIGGQFKLNYKEAQRMLGAKNI